MTDIKQRLFQPDDDWLKRFRRKLNAWYKRRQRELPWRGSKDLYAIWVSEIMLQQTQVATVIPYYERFLKRYPRVSHLADAPESEVLRHWEGLGYYRRARQLHSAAQQIRDQHNGEFPQVFEDVLALPGVGRYTAGAILSIGLDQRQPIVEANTVRLYSRLLLLQSDPTKSEGQKALWSLAEKLLPARGGSGQLNQALMELGSIVCTPQAPKCSECPVAELCPTHRHGLQAEIPVAKKRVAYQEVRESAIVVTDGERVLLRQCAAGERWAGLWDFVRFETPLQEAAATEARSAEQPPSPRELRDGAKSLLGVGIVRPKRLTVLKHGVTRFRITLHVYTARLQAGTLAEFAEDSSLRWVSSDELDDVPLSTTGRQISKLLHESGHLNRR